MQIHLEAHMMASSHTAENKKICAHCPHMTGRKRDEPCFVAVNPAHDDITAANPPMPCVHRHAGHMLLPATPSQRRPCTNTTHKAKHPPPNIETRSQAQSIDNPRNHRHTLKKPRKRRLRPKLPSKQIGKAVAPSAGVHRSSLAPRLQKILMLTDSLAPAKTLRLSLMSTAMTPWHEMVRRHKDIASTPTLCGQPQRNPKLWTAARNRKKNGHAGAPSGRDDHMHDTSPCAQISGESCSTRVASTRHSPSPNRRPAFDQARKLCAGALAADDLCRIIASLIRFIHRLDPNVGFWLLQENSVVGSLEPPSGRNMEGTASDTQLHAPLCIPPVWCPAVVSHR